MPRDGAVLLSEYPADKVRVTCRCGHHGQYDKAALMQRSGRGEKLPVLRLRLAAGMGCAIAAKTLAGEMVPGLEQCQMIYPDLAAARSPLG
jgi:hypothetical protein